MKECAWRCAWRCAQPGGVARICETLLVEEGELTFTTTDEASGREVELQV